jgi:hypothetical protein
LDKRFFNNRVPLITARINTALKPGIVFVSHVKKILLLLLMVLSLQFLSPGLFTEGSLSPAARPAPSLPSAGARGHAGAAALVFAAKTDGRFETYGQRTARLATFLTAKKYPAVSPLGGLVRAVFGTIAAPKVLRYLLKSVLNI